MCRKLILINLLFVPFLPVMGQIWELFQFRFQYIFSHRAKMYRNLKWKSLGCVTFGANLPHFVGRTNLTCVMTSPQCSPPPQQRLLWASVCPTRHSTPTQHCVSVRRPVFYVLPPIPRCGCHPGNTRLPQGQDRVVINAASHQRAHFPLQSLSCAVSGASRPSCLR